MTRLGGFADAAFAALVARFRRLTPVAVRLAFERRCELEELALPCKWTPR